MDYFDEKKKEFFLEFDCGDHITDGIFFYRMVFKQEISRRDFHEIMELARAADNRYANLYDKDFWDEHNIESFEKLRTDYQDMLEEVNYDEI